MPRSMVGLLAAVGTAMSALAALAHNDVVLALIAVSAGAATGLAASLALPSPKKSPNLPPGTAETSCRSR